MTTTKKMARETLDVGRPTAKLGGDELVIAKCLVQYLVERGLGLYFCFEELKREPNREFGIMYMYEVADRLPAEYRQEARSIVDLHLDTTPTTTVAA